MKIRAKKPRSLTQIIALWLVLVFGGCSDTPTSPPESAIKEWNAVSPNNRIIYWSAPQIKPLRQALVELSREFSQNNQWDVKIRQISDREETPGLRFLFTKKNDALLTENIRDLRALAYHPKWGIWQNKPEFTESLFYKSQIKRDQKWRWLAFIVLFDFTIMYYYDHLHLNLPPTIRSWSEWLSFFDKNQASPYIGYNPLDHGSVNQIESTLNPEERISLNRLLEKGYLQAVSSTFAGSLRFAQGDYLAWLGRASSARAIENNRLFFANQKDIKISPPPKNQGSLPAWPLAATIFADTQGDNLAAWLFIRYLASQKAQNVLIEKTGLYSIRKQSDKTVEPETDILYRQITSQARQGGIELNNGQSE